MIIQPKILKGFRDSLPQNEIPRKRIINTLEQVFERYGFVPIDTPVLEYTEVLLGKGGGETDKQVYAFQDHGKRDVSMRFDLTVPFARFMGAHVNELYLPFKRYHISKVWRGENTQRGRYREFYQCDFDIVGTESGTADAEILMLMYASFKSLGIEKVTFKLNDRGLFNIFLEYIGISDKYTKILRIVDKLAKIGSDKVKELLTDLTDEKSALTILDFISVSGSHTECMQKMEEFCGGNNERINRMKTLFSSLKDIIPEEKIVFDPSITRGLDYYTGLVYETFLDENPSIGSVCSGGRYDDLASLYTKTSLPGVGASIGLDRLLAALEEKSENKSAASVTEVLVFNLDEKYTNEYLKITEKIRALGYNAETFYQNKKMGQQFSYADKKNIAFAVICGEDEFKTGVFTLKNLNSRESYNSITFEKVKEILDNYSSTSKVN